MPFILIICIFILKKVILVCIHVDRFTYSYRQIHALAQEKQKEKIKQLEALRERRPPWPRQIITPIFPTVKMLSLGGERLCE